jgi:toxin ParE1/3/4
MQLRWTEEATADLEGIADYVLAHTPERATRLLRALYEAPRQLLTFPSLGRPGRKDGTRELVMSPLPWIIVYAVRGGLIYVVRILHGAQQWP